LEMVYHSRRTKETRDFLAEFWSMRNPLAIKKTTENE